MKRFLPANKSTVYSLPSTDKENGRRKSEVGRQRKGFTLIELLVVVTIIAILSVIAIAIFGGVTTRARDQRVKADIDAIAKAFEANYISESGEYIPLKDADFTSGAIPKNPNGDEYICEKGPNLSNDSDLPCTSVATNTFKVCGTLSDATQHCRSAAQGNIAPAPTPAPTPSPT